MRDESACGTIEPTTGIGTKTGFIRSVLHTDSYLSFTSQILTWENLLESESGSETSQA